MNTIYNDVKQWMEKQLGSSDMINSLSVDAIYALDEVRKLNVYQNQMLEVQRSLLVRQKEEFIKEEKLMHDHLEAIGFSIDAIDNNTYKAITSIVDTCRLLEISDTSDICILLAMQQARTDFYEVNRRVASKKPLLLDNESLLRYSRNIEKSLNDFKNTNIVISRNFNNHAFYEDKIVQYGNKCRKLISRSPELLESDREDNIIKLFQKNKDLNEKVSQFTSKFNHIDDIPPNIHLAILKVKEKKEKLAKIEGLLVNRMEEIRR